MPYPDLAETLRATIREARKSKTLSVIAEESGVAISTLSEFLSGKDLRLSNASQLAGYLGLELRAKKRTKPAS